MLDLRAAAQSVAAVPQSGYTSTSSRCPRSCVPLCGSKPTVQTGAGFTTTRTNVDLRTPANRDLFFQKTDRESSFFTEQMRKNRHDPFPLDLSLLH
ncbi:hypothetical protein CesoFtcFv8_013620 [Champsocephalus esox]|uniref:Uncharacterized protein n=2 Tax=Champsocephalus TaxID=52236 RepID=A0AAN8DEB2_CHAGU|nr:hypothetical protein CesoFtcFv8_013620 [Champsocephalus esox]KAK5920579.1 hypothetical protein CgunFtcFv8_024375 [Champsocephalus gunnari]